MPLRFPVWFPEMSITLVRRASAKLPRGNFIFRTDPKWTKSEIKEYLEKLYSIRVQRVATINYLGRTTRRRGLRPYTKLKDFKKVYVRIADEQAMPER